MAFDQATRNGLQNLVARCRKLLVDEFTSQGQGSFGIQPDGAIAPLESLTGLDDAEYAVARQLRDRIEHIVAGLSGEKKPYKTAVDRVIREQAFSVLNRFAALRMAEERKLVMPCISGGYDSKGFKLFLTVSGSDLGDSYSRYRTYLLCVCDEISLDLGVLFDRFSSFSLLFPGETTLKQLLDELNAPEFAALWAEDETIGWLYQYWNSKEERKKMRDASSAPRNSRELAVRNQFFTPRYVVEFLTDNTLGRIWYEMTKGKTRLAEQCRYLVRRPNEIFLGSRWPDIHPAPEGSWVARVATGDLSELPEEVATEDIQALAFLVDGYAEAERLGWDDVFEACGGFLTEHFERGKPLPDDLLSVWLCLFSCVRGRVLPFFSRCHEPEVLAELYAKWRLLAMQAEDSASQEELLRRPVLIPHRPLKDPREIRLLDPACGSMHFGLYAFDLFEIIYDEAWQLGLVPKEHFGADTGSFPHESVRKKRNLESVHSNDTNGKILARTARVVILKQNDPGDGMIHTGPYLAPPERTYRPGVAKEMPLAEFDYQDAIATGWISQEEGERLVSETDAFAYDEPLSAEGVEASFRNQIPRLIIEHNIHGVDIDPRAVQIAGLSLWLRAQRSWGSQGIKPADRPRVHRSNIVCAEPMPGSPEMLEDFIATLDPPLLGELVRTVFNSMRLAGEAGTLLKIEEEIRAAIDDARKQWFKEQDDLLTRKDGSEDKFFDTAEERIYTALREYAESAEAGDYQRRLFAEDAAHGFSFIDLCRKRYDAIVMNPPFGSGLKATAKYLKREYPGAGGDEICASFFSRSLQLLCRTGRVGEISSRTCFFLPTLATWRTESLFGESALTEFADLGINVLDDAVNETAAYVAQKGRRSAPTVFGMFHRSQDKESSVSALANLDLQPGIFVRHADDFAALPDRPLCYWVSQSFLAALDSMEPFGDETASVQMGLAPRDEFRFSRLWWEVVPATTGRDKRWTGYAKGGELSPYYSDVELVLNAYDDLREIKAALNKKYPYLKGNLDWVLHPENDYFDPGLTFGQRTSQLRASALPAQCFFSVAGKAIFGRRISNGALLQAINSPSAQFLVALRRESFEMNPQFQEGDVARMPWPKLDFELEQKLEELGMANAAAVRAVASNDEIDHAFVVVRGNSSQGSPTEIAKETVAENERRAENLISPLLSLGDLDLWFLKQEIMPKWSSRSIANWFTTSIHHDTVSYAFGSAFGRWEILYATGERQPPELPDPFDPLPVCPPGMLQNADGLPAAPADLPVTYPLRISWPGILVDDENHPEDIVARVRDALGVIWGNRADVIEQEACEILGVKELRDYFGKPTKFFADHLKRYSKSRRKAPIYWPLSTESGSYTIWIYYHRLTDQTLFNVVNDYVNPKIGEVEGDIARIQENMQGGVVAADRDEFTRLQSLRQELIAFRDELLRVAGLPYRPNLNDGVQITAAPLQKLFQHTPWQKVLKDTWKALADGDYDWAHIALSIWPARAVAAAHADRSIAIAHDLEDALWHETEVTKKRGKKITTKLEWQPKPLTQAELDTIVADVKTRSR